MSVNVVGSKVPEFASDQLKASNRGYGQNQFRGASSDLPGERTTSGFLPDTTLAAGNAANKQMRTVSGKQYPTTFGNTGPRKG